jgi:hypothetical protein
MTEVSGIAIGGALYYRYRKICMNETEDQGGGLLELIDLIYLIPLAWPPLGGLRHVTV